MKEKTVRVPDEDELWSLGIDWYLVRRGQFVRVGLMALSRALDAPALKRALYDFIDPTVERGPTCPRVADVHHNSGGWCLRYDDYRDRVTQIVCDRLNEWAKDTTAINKALEELTE